MPPFSGTDAGMFSGKESVFAHENLDDPELMRRAKAGDLVAFELLAHRFQQPILGFVYRTSPGATRAEELAQEVFLRLYRTRRTYRPTVRFRSWLYRIAVDVALNADRGEHVSGARSSNETEPEADHGGERQQSIRQSVRALPEQERIAVILHKYQGLDYQEIAEVLRLDESATKTLLFRAYRRLSEDLRKLA